MFRLLLAWVLRWAFNREKRMAATITINGITIPLSDFEALANDLIGGVKSGKKPEDILKDIAPDLLPIAETIASGLVPYGGAIIALLVFAYSKSIPFKDLPQAEQNRIQNMQGAGPT